MIFKLPYQNEKAIAYIQKNKSDRICEIKKQDKSRSYLQNRYYWFLLTILEGDTGMVKDDFHIYFRAKFLQHTKEINGDMVEYTRSTTELNTLEFEDYLSKIRMFASVEIGCFLPLPNETEFNYAEAR